MVREKPFKTKEHKLEKNYKEQEKTKMEKSKFYRFNIQMFAEGDQEPEVTPTEPTIEDLKAEIEKQRLEIEKQKKEKDKYSKELGDLKKAQVAKLSVEEQEKQARQELEEQLKQAQLEINSTKMSKEFLKIGFDEKTITDLVKVANEQDVISFIQALSTPIMNLIENVRKEEKANFLKSSYLPNGSNPNGNKGIDPIIQQMLDKQKEENKARKLIIGK